MSMWRPTVSFFVLLALSGCTEPARPPAPPKAPPTAEESFAKIVGTLTQRIENEPLVSGGQLDAPPGTPVADARVYVSHELAPAVEGEPRRGSICFSTKAKVTVVLPPPNEEDQKQDRAKTESEVAELQAELEGVADIDSLVVPTTEGLNSRLGKSPIHEITPDDESCYELEHRDGRWELLTELDKENEPFFALEMEFAIKKQ
ncbi:hypothetical protein MalM25_00540 [Planctomycetes bacterium MalM25]|nr:hypothetical protein MalM25_00540 [Planctomycetes bacterium MalM25]